ncbi:MAG: AAA domain-containing protein [bacterium]|nr:AAA domain-containing protein [bacterium]
MSISSSGPSSPSGIPMVETDSVPECVLTGLFSLAASPAVELPQLLDAILEAALGLTCSDAGGAIWLQNPNNPGCCHFKAAGGILRCSQSALTRELANPSANPRPATALDSESCYHYCEDAREQHASCFLFREGRSLVYLPLLRGEPAPGMLQVEARHPGAFSEKDLCALSELNRVGSLLIERLLLKEHAFAAGFDIHPVGSSREFLELESLIRRVACDPSNPVLIRGERGSGKELVAYATHYFSRRRHKPFVAVNSAALCDGLAADELFGHERGAYTGADLVRGGLFQSAHEGSLFFDEIGDMPLNVQAFLLRALDHGEIRQVGGDKPLKVDVRIIAASNRTFEQLMEKGNFRSDLYDRLNVLQIHVPPLRERKDDLKLLADFFLRKACLNSGRYRRMSERGACRACLGSGGKTCAGPALYGALADHDYPGNVRELRNQMFRLAATVPDQELAPAHLCPGVAKNGNGRTSDGDPRLDSIIRDHIRHVLEKTGGNKSAAARTLGLPLTTLINKMKRLGIG